MKLALTILCYAVLAVTSLRAQDSATHIIAPHYKAGAFKKWLLGNNYRSEWTTPVTAPVLQLSTQFGGMKPVRQGGGMQSRSLRLEDSTGREYVLRSIEKYPDKTLPEELRETFIKDAVVDGISASYPFAALSIPVLAEAAGIPHLHPKLFYLPDDPALGVFRKTFANGLFLLEPREPDTVSRTWNSEKLLEEMQEDNENRVDQLAVLRARILDMYMMDFDRHEDQWRWGRNKSRGQTIYYPVPRDRDQPFFTNDGFLPGIISRNWLQPKFQGFRAKARDINTFNFNARYFDRLYLNEPDESQWKKITDNLLLAMTDDVIERALAAQPASIQQQHAPEIINILKERRRHLSDEMLQYYRFLARTITVTGSDKREYFDLEWLDNGLIRLSVSNLHKDGNKDNPFYQRDIDPGNTRELRLFAMKGNDLFRLRGSAGNSPLIRIISGEGADSLLVEPGLLPRRLLRWYDQLSEPHFVDHRAMVRKVFSTDSSVHHFDPHSYRYNQTAPLVSVAFNPDDGIFLGGGIRITRHGFRKQPFSTRQLIQANYAIGSGAYSFKYQLDAIDLVPVPFSTHRRLDLRLVSNLKAPNYIQNFFGYGNNTEFPDTGDRKISYYRSRFNLFELAALLKAHPLQKLTLLGGPVNQHYRIDREDNNGKFLADPDGGLDPSAGLDPERLFQPKTYIGVQLEAILDTRNHAVMPASGIKWNNRVRWIDGTSSHAYAFGQLETDVSFYTKLTRSGNLILAGRIGAGANNGRPEFFQSQFLGGNENLRGYRKYRFAGRSMAYNNLDLRLKLANIKGYILPGILGMVAFHDIGRVWVKGEYSRSWHSGYGAGLWLAPAGQFVATACYAWSDDGGLPFISLGFQF